jgi:hypothetical protein
MKVYGTKDINGVDRPPVPKEGRAPAAPEERPAADRVTLEAPQVAEALSSARQRTSASRVTRLKELETALKGGAYRPDVGQLAEKLLSAAEVDARLRAMMRG